MMSSRSPRALPWIALTLVVVAVAVASQVTKAPAVMFRGDARHTGVYPASPATNFAGVRWRVATDGPVRSSPAVTAGTVFIGSNDGHLYAIDRASGAVRWRSRALGAISSSPAVANGVVVVTTPGGCVAFEATGGAERWQVKNGPTLPFPWGYESGDRYIGSPVITDNLVIYGGGDGSLRALNLNDGKVKWSAPLGTRLRSSPAIAPGLVVVGGADGVVHAVALETGKPAWQFRTEGHTLNSIEYGFDRRTVQSSPAISDSLAIVGARDGFVYAIRLGDGSLAWRMDHHVSWINSSAAIAGGLAVVGTSDGHFTQAIDLKDGRERWRTPSQNIVWGSAAISGTAVYVGDGSGILQALDLTSGAVRWSWRAGGAILSSPVVADSTIYLGSDDGGVYAVALTAGARLQRAVFWDSTLVGSSFFRGQEPVRRWLASRGYDTLAVATLGRWLDARAQDRQPSVVVFAMDVLPAADTAAFRRYLDHGGKVVWLGVPPALWPHRPDGGLDLKDVDREAARRFLGVTIEHGNFDPHGATATPIGTRWGLSGWFVSNWGADTSGLDEVLATDDEGLAAAWVRRFGGRPGSGFIRLYGVDWGDVAGRSPSALSVQVAAEFFPR